MCGIVGILGKDDVAPAIMDALKRLEYRGYDSAGIATSENGHLERRRAQGKLENLVQCLAQSPLNGRSGIGHTRWATHGAPTEMNAHPHATDRVSIVHNGIIENFRELRQRLASKGYAFETETDSEVIAQLTTHFLDEGLAPVEAARTAIGELEGAFAIAMIFLGEHDLMVGARKGSPLVVGYGDGEAYLGSDALALASLTQKISYLDDGDWVELSRSAAIFHDETGAIVERPIVTTSVSGALVDKGNHRHFMAKEIFEQPEVIGHTLSSYLDPINETVRLPELTFDLAEVPRITLIGCGTASYAGMVAKYWFEQIARITVEVDIASEFRYREAPMPEGGLAIFISQSGETADTLAALRYCREQGQHILSIVNVPESSIARESDMVMPIHAGPEIGVASTKAFTCQLAALAVLVLATARARGKIDGAQEAAFIRELLEVPRHLVETFKRDRQIEKLARDLARASDILYLGRGINFPLALEGALKLKEISYIHAEGYAAGELKHGPIALIDDDVPVVVLAPSDALFEKTVSNMEEVIARGGKVVLISDADGLARAGDHAWATICIPDCGVFTHPIVYSVPVQLLAYHTAQEKGTDVDQPRNLAKSVTVE